MSNSGILISPILINLLQSREGKHRAQGRTAITELIMDPKRVGQSECTKEREKQRIAKGMRELAGIFGKLKNSFLLKSSPYMRYKWDSHNAEDVHSTVDCGPRI